MILYVRILSCICIVLRATVIYICGRFLTLYHLMLEGEVLPYNWSTCHMLQGGFLLIACSAIPLLDDVVGTWLSLTSWWCYRVLFSLSYWYACHCLINVLVLELCLPDGGATVWCSSSCINLNSTVIYMLSVLDSLLPHSGVMGCCSPYCIVLHANVSYLF